MTHVKGDVGTESMGGAGIDQTLNVPRLTCFACSSSVGSGGWHRVGYRRNR